MEAASEVTTDITNVSIYKHNKEIMQYRDNVKKRKG